MTLAEVLLTVTLFSTVLAAVAGLVRSGLRVQGLWDGQVSSSQRLERALNRFEEDLEAARPLFQVPFIAEASRLEAARLDQVLQQDGTWMTEWLRLVYRFEPTIAGSALIREEFLWRPGIDAEDPLSQDTVLAVAGGQFEFAMLDANGQVVWVPTWDAAQPGLPRLVRLTCTVPMATDGPPTTLRRVVRSPAGILPTMDTP